MLFQMWSSSPSSTVTRPGKIKPKMAELTLSDLTSWPPQRPVTSSPHPPRIKKHTVCAPWLIKYQHLLLFSSSVTCVLVLFTWNWPGWGGKWRFQVGKNDLFLLIFHVTSTRRDTRCKKTSEVGPWGDVHRIITNYRRHMRHFRAY